MPLTDRDRKTIRIGAIVAGVMVVLVLGLNFLGRGGDTDTIALPSIPVPTGGPTTTEPPTGTGGPSVGPTSSTSTPVAVFTGRDPFSLPLVFQTTTTTTTTTGTSPTSGTSPTTSGTSPGTSGTSTSTSSSTSTSTSTSGGQPGTDARTRVGGHDVVLLDTFTMNGVDTVQVEVDGQVYDVAEGDTFGPGNSFELMSVSGNCAAFVFGDESFTLCVRPQK